MRKDPRTYELQTQGGGQFLGEPLLREADAIPIHVFLLESGPHRLPFVVIRIPGKRGVVICAPFLGAGCNMH